MRMQKRGTNSPHRPRPRKPSTRKLSECTSLVCKPTQAHNCPVFLFSPSSSATVFVSFPAQFASYSFCSAASLLRILDHCICPLSPSLGRYHPQFNTLSSYFAQNTQNCTPTQAPPLDGVFRSGVMFRVCCYISFTYDKRKPF